MTLNKALKPRKDVDAEGQVGPGLALQGGISGFTSVRVSPELSRCSIRLAVSAGAGAGPNHEIINQKSYKPLNHKSLNHNHESLNH